jgi:hypothetical protein
MSEFDRLKKPFLTEKDEECQMLKDFAREYNKQEKGSTRQKSGNATHNVIQQHLIGKEGIKLPKNSKVKIREVETKMNLLYLLNKKADTNQSDYSVHDLDGVLKTSNNAVGSSKENTPSEPVRNTFEKFRQRNKELRFGVVVLIENPEYMNRFKGPFRAFTLIYRDPKTPKVLYDSVGMIDDLLKNNQLKQSGDWESLIEFSKGK